MSTPEKVDTVVRAVRLEHHANTSKIHALTSMIGVWNSALTACKHDKIADLRLGGNVRRFRAGEWTTFRAKQFGLTARQAKSVENQVNAALRSWQALAVIEGRRIITERKNDGDYSDEQAHRLYIVNKAKRWWSDYEGVDLIEDILKANPFPVFSSNSTILFDDLIAPMAESVDAEHPVWISFRVLNGETVHVPVDPGAYFENYMALGDPAAITQVNIQGENKVVLRRMVKMDAAEARDSGEVLGLDWGLNTLFATSDGRLLGRALYQWLSERDDELTDLDAALRKQGIKPTDSKRHRKLVNRIRSYVRNEVGRILNSLADEDIQHLVVERLDFRGGGLSKKLNRIVNKAGRSAVTQKLSDLQERRGITFTEVNPAYTSQTCHGCGFTSPQNRRGEKFRCRFCRKTSHSDINGARNHLSRRSRAEEQRYRKREKILADLDQLFYTRWGIPADRIRERFPVKAASSSQGTPVQLGSVERDRSASRVNCG